MVGAGTMLRYKISDGIPLRSFLRSGPGADLTNTGWRGCQIYFSKEVDSVHEMVENPAQQ